jgi:hypothetical protein
MERDVIPAVAPNVFSEITVGDVVLYRASIGNTDLYEGRVAALARDHVKVTWWLIFSKWIEKSRVVSRVDYQRWEDEEE